MQCGGHMGAEEPQCEPGHAARRHTWLATTATTAAAMRSAVQPGPMFTWCSSHEPAGLPEAHSSRTMRPLSSASSAPALAVLWLHDGDRSCTGIGGSACCSHGCRMSRPAILAAVSRHRRPADHSHCKRLHTDCAHELEGTALARCLPEQHVTDTFQTRTCCDRWTCGVHVNLEAPHQSRP